MIRHVVTWKLKAEDAEGKAASVAAIAGALEPLVHLDGIRALKVHANAADIDGNWDAVLVGDYDSVDALKAYVVHPEHVAAVTIVREHTLARSAVDFEVVE
jgi:hypothetical protein